MDITANEPAYRVSRSPRARSRTRRVRSGRICAEPAGERNPRRGLTALELVVIVALVIAVVAAALVSRSQTPTDLPTQRVKVGSGDSLWSLAESHPLEGLTTQQTMDLIKRANNMRSDRIAAGSLVIIPVARRSEVAIAP